MPDTAEHALIGRFASVAQAEDAAQQLVRWDDAHEEIKLGAVGLFFKDPQGELQTRNLSTRNTRKGAKVGLGLGVLAAVLSGGLTLIPSAVAGVAGGSAVGALSHKGLGLTDSELERLWTELDGGQAALLVMCDAPDVEATTAWLVTAGAAVDGHPVTTEDLEAAAQAVERATSPTPETPPPA